MLMVVLGAGASFDSIPSRPPEKFNEQLRPPLADQLFDDRGWFVEILKEFPACHPVVPFLQNLPPGVTLEHRLEELQAEASAYPARVKQLTAVRFYLQKLLSACDKYWHDQNKGITNYKTLLDLIERWLKPEERVCLVTFNYDRLIEYALRDLGMRFDSLSDYVGKGGYDLIKLHGSVDWGHPVESVLAARRASTAEQVRDDLIERAVGLKISSSYVHVDSPPFHERDFALFPAIAIPVETKHQYECPPEHLQVLHEVLPKIDRLLLIGWRASEPHFLELLRTQLQGKPRIYIVAGTAQGAASVQANLEGANVPYDATIFNSGFTDFVVTRAVDKFLAA